MNLRVETLNSFRSAAAAEPWRPGDERAVVIASGTRSGGCSTVAVLLALACAAESRRTLLIDGANDSGPLKQLVPGGLEPSGEALHPAAYDVVLVDAGSTLETVNAAAAGIAWRFLILTGTSPASLASSYALVKAIDARWPSVPVDLLVSGQSVRSADEAFQQVRQATVRFLHKGVRFGGAIPREEALCAPELAGGPLPLPGRGTRAGHAAHVVAAKLLAELDEDIRRPDASQLLERRR